MSNNNIFKGDSGGPLVCNGIQAGVVSFGLECALPNTPAVYVDVATYIPWLRNVTGLRLSSANTFGKVSQVFIFLCLAITLLH